MTWAHAITRLQRANAGVLACSALDVRGLETAMLEREAAVQMIARLTPERLSEAEIARFQDACGAGDRIADRLRSIYPAAQAELQHAKRVRAFLQKESTFDPRQAS